MCSEKRLLAQRVRLKSSGSEIIEKTCKRWKYKLSLTNYHWSNTISSLKVLRGDANCKLSTRGKHMLRKKTKQFEG